MELFTKKEMMLMFDSFNGIHIDSKFSQKTQLFGVFDEGNHLFNKWDVNKKQLRKKLDSINEDEAKLIVREILNYWDKLDSEQIADHSLNKAILEEDYEFAAKIRDGKISESSLQSKLINSNREELIRNKNNKENN